MLSVSDNLYPLIHIPYNPRIMDWQEGGDEMATRDRGVYAISVAADMVSMEIQNLRVYERRGLLEPARTAGGTRLYSSDDIDRLNRIRELLADGLNLAGIARVLRLEDELQRLRAANARLRGAARE
jgi:MerR family transcriptional regulator, heat shock protein HspR